MMYENEIRNAMHTMNTALTAEEVKKAYREILKSCHPDNITTEADIDLLTNLYNCKERNLAKLGNRLEQWKREQEAGQKVKAIRHEFRDADELLSSGAEMLSVLEGTIRKVSKVFSGKAPRPNKKQITDKHHADQYGNMDGMRSYPWASIILNKNYTINRDMMENAIQETAKQLLMNKDLEQYAGIPVSVLVWVSARQALNNIYYNEVVKPSYLQIEKKHDVYDLEAYQTTATEFWTTESTATTRVYIESLTRSPFERKVLALREMGFKQDEIAKAYGTSQQTISNVIERIYNRLLCDRMTAHLDSLEAIREKNGQKRNASEKAMLKALIMRSIKNGMTYQRIAYHLHLAEYETENGDRVTINDQIKKMLTA